MTTTSAEGLPELPAPDFVLRWDSMRAAYYVSRPNVGNTDVYTADQMRAYGELCRAAPAGGDGPPEFTDTARAALLWVLWHHQGASSKVGQPIRFALGMAQHERMNDYQLREAKRWGEIHYAAPSVSMSDELFAELELSVKQADKIIRSDKGCGACGDGCSDRGSCRLTDESPSAERCQKCHGTLEVLTNYAEPWSASAYSPCPDCHPAAKKDSAPAGSGEVEDWMVELFDEVYEREWNRAADEADDRHKAIIGPADRHATREAIAALLRKLQQGADYVMVPRELTLDMELAAKAAAFDFGTDGGWDAGAMAHEVWRAAIAASQGQEGGK